MMRGGPVEAIASENLKIDLSTWSPGVKRNLAGQRNRCRVGYWKETGSLDPRPNNDVPVTLYTEERLWIEPTWRETRVGKSRVKILDEGSKQPLQRDNNIALAPGTLHNIFNT
jgi:hypothetical protein